MHALNFNVILHCFMPYGYIKGELPMKKASLIILLFSFSFSFSNQLFSATTTPTKKRPQKSKNVKVNLPSIKSTNTQSEGKISQIRSSYSHLNNTNSLGDLQFMPMPGEVSATAELAIKPSTLTASFKGKDVAESKESATTQSYKINYGILENLSLGVSIEHFISGKRETELIDQKKTVTTKASGLSDPVINGTYRLTTQQLKKVNTDLTLSFSPSVIKAEEASEDKKGSRGRGTFMTQAKVEVGAKLAAFSVSGNASLLIEGEKEIKDLTTNEKFKIDSNTAFAVGGAIRKELMDDFALKGGLDLTFIGEEKRKSAGKSFYTMDSFTRLGFSAEAQYTIVSEKVLAKLLIRLNSDGSRTLKLNDNTLDVDSSNGQVYLLGGDFIF